MGNPDTIELQKSKEEETSQLIYKAGKKSTNFWFFFIVFIIATALLSVPVYYGQATYWALAWSLLIPVCYLINQWAESKEILIYPDKIVVKSPYALFFRRDLVFQYKYIQSISFNLSTSYRGANRLLRITHKNGHWVLLNINLRSKEINSLTKVLRDLGIEVKSDYE